VRLQLAAKVGTFKSTADVQSTYTINYESFADNYQTADANKYSATLASGSPNYVLSGVLLL